jgi:hypothetical protein
MGAQQSFQMRRNALQEAIETILTIIDEPQERLPTKVSFEEEAIIHR